VFSELTNGGLHRLKEQGSEMRGGFLSIVWIGVILLVVFNVAAGQPPVTPPTPEKVPVYQPKYYPFDSGERAVYKASWNGIPVAIAEISTTSQIIDGKKFYNVQVEAKTSPVLDLIWKMRDTITSTIEAKALAPTRFTFSQRENRKIIDTEARFDRATKKWFVHRDERRKVKKYEFDQPPNTIDPITAVYLARSQDLKVGDHLYFNIFGGRYRYLLDLEVERREKIQITSGSVDAFKIVPRIKNLMKQGYAERMNEASVWISADERRIPVMLNSKIFVGSIYIERIEDKIGPQAAGVAHPISQVSASETSYLER
jgi:Protein of unknown function (DUF3108)